MPIAFIVDEEMLTFVAPHTNYEKRKLYLSEMKSFIYSFLILSFVFIASACDQVDYPLDVIVAEPEERCPVQSVVGNELYYKDADGNKFLWAGDDPKTHFNINTFSLDVCNLKYGYMGREHFPALMEPKYEPLSDVIDDFDDIEKTLILRSSSGVKVFPFSILVKHELINEIVNGKPVMVVYCFLANLTAVYNRRYCGKDLTFGVSGYTYLDNEIQNGLESFVLWDRDTESLWWPIVEKGISDSFTGIDMERHDESKWEEMRWGDVKNNYPNALVLKDSQTFEPPSDWPTIESSQLHCF